METQITNIITMTITNYINSINSNYPSIDKKVLLELWNIVNKSETPIDLEKLTKKIDIKKVETKKSKSDDEKSVSSKASKNTDRRTCQYKFSKGNKMGQICGVGIKTESEFCSTHSKNKKTPAKTETKTTKKYAKLNTEINMLWDKDTGFVFDTTFTSDNKTKTDFTVLCVYKNNKINPLSEDDIKYCNTHGFKYDLDYVTKQEVKKQEAKIEKDNKNKEVADIKKEDIKVTEKPKEKKVVEKPKEKKKNDSDVDSDDSDVEHILDDLDNDDENINELDGVDVDDD